MNSPNRSLGCLKAEIASARGCYAPVRAVSAIVGVIISQEARP